MEEERHTPYSASKRRRTTVDQGRVTKCVDYGEGKSDVEREADDLDRYKEDRRKFREALEKKRRAHQDPANSPKELHCRSPRTCSHRRMATSGRWSPPARPPSRRVTARSWRT